MAHINTELLADYWRARRPAFGSPPRSSIDPSDIVDLLPQVFILGRPAVGHYNFRLVGGLVADLHDRALLGSDFLDLWSPADRPALKSSMESAARRSEPMIVSAVVRSRDGQQSQTEILLAPVAGVDGAVDRFLGLYQPLAIRMRYPVQWLVVQRIIAGPTMAETPRLRLASVDGRQIA